MVFRVFVIAGALHVLSVLSSACAPFPSKNVTNTRLEEIDIRSGIVMGSLNSDFFYRSFGDGGKTSGALMVGVKSRTLGTPFWFPDKAKDGLPENGKLFAVELPEGDYELSKRWDSEIAMTPPARFSVKGGTISYLGGLRVEFCQGIVAYRRAVLGFEVTIEDHFQRDIALLMYRYPALRKASVEKKLLVGRWRWRNPLRGLFGQVEPRDWGTCVSR